MHTYCRSTATYFSSFVCIAESKLIKDPAKFDPKSCLVEFKNACAKYNIAKMDLVRELCYFSFFHFPFFCCVSTTSDTDVGTPFGCATVDYPGAEKSKRPIGH